MKLISSILFVLFPLVCLAEDMTNTGFYFTNWRTNNVIPMPLATLEPLTPIPTIDPDEQHDDGDTGSANVSNNRGVSFILQMCSANAKDQDKFWETAYKYSSTINAGWLYGQTSHLTGCEWSKKFMKLSKPKRVRVHICNCTCFKDRGRKCGPNECFPGADMTTAKANQMVANHNAKLFKTIDKIIKKAVEDAEAANLTLVDYAVSPCLESGLTAANRKIMMQYIEGKFASYAAYRASKGLNPIRFVDNPVRDTCLKSYFCEKHGDIKRGAKGIADLDGIPYDGIAQADYGEINKKAWMVLLWDYCLNGLPKGADFQYPNTRTGWCGVTRDANNYAHFTDDNFQAVPDPIQYADADLKGCTSYRKLDSDKFVWKLGEGRNFTTAVMPKGVPAFQKMWIMKNGKQIDYTGGVGKRVAKLYHDNVSLIYDFQKPLQNYPDNVVLHGKPKNATGEVCWKFPKPSFRPFRNPNLQRIN